MESLRESNPEVNASVVQLKQQLANGGAHVQIENDCSESASETPVLTSVSTQSERNKLIENALLAPSPSRRRDQSHLFLPLTQSLCSCDLYTVGGIGCLRSGTGGNLQSASILIAHTFAVFGAGSTREWAVRRKEEIPR